MKKWEYKIQSLYEIDGIVNFEKNEETLNTLGKNGWEFIGQCREIFIFKRPLEEDNLK